MADPVTHAGGIPPTMLPGRPFSLPQKIAIITGLLLIIGSAVIATDILSVRDRNPGLMAGTAPASAAGLRGNAR